MKFLLAALPHLRARLSFAFTLLLIAGCHGDGLNRVVVSGAVSLQGVPVEDGQIRFVPDEGTVGPLTVAAIRQGRYRCDLKGGVPVGRHRVEILAWDPQTPAPRGPGDRPRSQWVPENFNTKSTLTMSVENTGRPITHDFNL